MKKDGFTKDDIVYARCDITTRSSADIPLTTQVPPSCKVRKNTAGIYCGRVRGIPDHAIVEFEQGAQLVRVEVPISELALSIN